MKGVSCGEGSAERCSHAPDFIVDEPTELSLGTVASPQSRLPFHPVGSVYRCARPAASGTSSSCQSDWQCVTWLVLRSTDSSPNLDPHKVTIPLDPLEPAHGSNTMQPRYLRGSSLTELPTDSAEELS